MRSANRTALTAAFIVAVAAVPAVAQQVTVAPPPELDSLRLMISQMMEKTHAPSIAIAVAQHGKILWEEGFGFADIGRHISATPHTLYSMASISKPITATGLMTLVQRGAIVLDHPANDYLGRGKITGFEQMPTGVTSALSPLGS